MLDIPLPSAFGPPGEHQERPGHAVIADFLRKVLKLGLLRLADLCDRMDFDPLERQDILTQVRTGLPPAPAASFGHPPPPGGPAYSVRCCRGWGGRWIAKGTGA